MCNGGGPPPVAYSRGLNARLHRLPFSVVTCVFGMEDSGGTRGWRVGDSEIDYRWSRSGLRAAGLSRLRWTEVGVTRKRQYPKAEGKNRRSGDCSDLKGEYVTAVVYGRNFNARLHRVPLFRRYSMYALYCHQCLTYVKTCLFQALLCLSDNTMQAANSKNGRKYY